MPSGAAVADVAPEGTKKSSFRPDIQGLRAVAVLAVIADHLFKWPTGGFVGVDVFFVISGFLITGILLREYDKTEHISFLGFYNRRIRRIIPAATLVLVVTVAASWFLLTRTRFWETAADAFWAFFFMGNWHMALVGTDYFQLGLPPSPVQHYWSLSVEEQFYFVWPWMMLGLLLLTARIGWNKSSRRRLIEVVFIVATATSFAWSMYETSTNPTFAYFSTFSRAWELGVGAILAAAVPLLSRIPDAVRPVLGWVGLLGIAGSIFLINSDMPFPGPWAAAPVLATALTIAAGTGATRDAYNWAMLPLTNPVSRYVGDISYSLYLWHFPIIILMLAVLPADSAAYVIICVVGMFGLAALSYHFVENAFRVRAQTSDAARRKRHRRRSRRHHRGRSSVTPMQWVTFAVVGVAAGTLAVAALIPREASSAARPASTASVEASAAECFGADFMDATRGPQCDPAALGDELRPTVDGLADDKGIAYDCYRPEDADLKTCTYGKSKPDSLRVAIIGDSHAAMLIPALVPNLDDLNWTLDTYVGNGCQWKSTLSNSCADAMTQIRSIVTTEPYDVIITTGARWVGGNIDFATNAYATAWRDAINVGTKVIAVADVPGASEEALACIARIGFNPASNNCGTTESEALAQADPIISAASAAGVPLVNMSDYYCREGFCPSVIGHAQVYRDTASHITATYMTSLAPYLVARIQAAISY